MTLHCRGTETAPASHPPAPALRTSVTRSLQGLEKPRCSSGPALPTGLSIPKGLCCGITARPQVSYSSRNGKNPWQAELLRAGYRIQGPSRSSCMELDKASAFLTLTVGDLLL